MNVNSDTNAAEGDETKTLGVCNKSTIFDHAPLAAPEDDSDDCGEYAQVKDVYGGSGGGGGGIGGVSGIGDDLNNDQMYSFPPNDSTPNKSGKVRHRREKGQSM